MESLTRSSACVAPLQIVKGTTRVVTPSSRTPNTSLTMTNGVYLPQRTGQMTPPLTPHDSEMSFERRTDFQTYLRASYPYQPESHQSLTTVTLPLNSGDVILVHSVHSSGWADGTLLVSGARGWLPTNYCEGYESEPIRNLMKALTVFWDLWKGSSVGGLVVFRNSDYVRGLVAGVRCLLTRTNCLNRESNLIQSHDVLRRNRKALLADLSAFVKVAEALKTLLTNSSGELGVELDLEEMALKAFKMVNRAVKFLDIWEEHMQSINVSVTIDDAKIMRVPPTPPADQSQFALSRNNQEIDSNAHNTQANSENAKREQTGFRPRYGRSSQTSVRPGSSNSFGQFHGLVKRESTSHRTSCTAHPVSQNLASVKLTALHNGFITSLAYFIGLHIQSRSSAEICLTTEQSVVSCRDMLRLVEEIWERDWRRSFALQEAHDTMYEKIADLADAAKDISKSQGFVEDGDTLVYAATACVRAAGECVTESQLVIERIGDFELESFGLGILDLEDVARPAENPIHVVEDQRDVTTKDLPLPPEREPPPTPSKLPDQDLPAASTMSATTPYLDCSLNVMQVESGETLDRSSARHLLPPLPPFTSCLLSYEDPCSSPPSSNGSVGNMHNNNDGRTREDSLGVSSSFDSSTYVGSTHDSEPSIVSQSSTRATSPDATFVTPLEHPSCIQSVIYEDGDEDEVKLLETTFAHELVYNREGQISGGTLPALIERLTTHDSTPDATFVSTFYLTFRLFATPIAFAQALIDRFQYVGESPYIAGPVRLRVYNVFKGWLESHWRNDCDSPALELIVPFAKRQLQIVLPTAGKRLATLASKVTAANGPLVPRLISSIGKTNTSIALYVSPDTPLPASIITKSQLVALKNWKHGGASISILDFDPLELARQFTIKESQIFCSILPEELLATEWMKKSGSMAVNVRAMSRLSTDLTNLVTDYILQLEDPKKRAIVIKQWVKIAKRFLELANYDSLFAVICSLESSTILRLRRTWELVSSKTKATLEHLKSVVDISKNYVVLRQRLQNHVPPCLPFVGTYLTDLTFVDIGNQTTRQLLGGVPEESKSVINFDKHMKTAKIISELQRFQIPYRFTEIPELQTWMQDQLVRVRTSDESSMQNHYRRSLILEPRDHVQCKPSPLESQASFSSTKDKLDKDKFEFFGLGWPYHSKHHSRDKTVTRPTSPS